ncbi:MAG: serine/threonine-protein phosphatase, partial [Clostridia bacterium]|nr:serine/threonine-protein phosphatase [Clostridia bacterium]
MKIIYETDIGQLRKENQDAVWAMLQTETCGLAVVCDGMGGVNGGLQASTLSIRAIQEMIHEKPFRGKDVQSYLKEIIDRCNREVFRTAIEHPEYSGMGTTLVMALIYEDKVYFANVGDSRGYHIKNGSIQQITKDHSAVQELVDSGHLTERQAKKHPNKNIITRAIGVDEELQFDLYEVQAAQGDIIILCSD